MSKARKKSHIILTIVIIIAVVMAYLLFDSNYRIVTTEYEVYSEKIPAEFDGFRIVQLSDLHEQSFGEDNVRLLDSVSAAEPDIIAVTGDLVDFLCEDVEGYVRPLMDELVKIAPVFYVSGNHEWVIDDTDAFFDLLEECGVTVLHNEYLSVNLGEGTVVLAGAEDPNGPYDMKKPDELVSEIREEFGDTYIIMLNHRNDAFETYADLGVDLVLSGHAHGGIIRLPFTDGIIDPNRNWFPTNTAGSYTLGGTEMIVSRGLGGHVAVPRFLNNPHIPVIILRTGNIPE